ncbi:MAG: thiamine diphosphokinase [Anaerolineae bacterium]|jgi:thiamine pyrophosphokinase
MRAVIFANGLFPEPEAHRHLLQPDGEAAEPLIIAVDGGAIHAQAAGAIPDVAIGDLDSLDVELRTQLETEGTRFIPHPPAKDETDLELALLYAAQEGADEILILAALGGRLDQTFANVLLLSHPALAEIQVRIIERNQTAFLILDQAIIEGKPGDTVSLIPLGGDAHGVTADKGLKWPLHDETLHFGLARGVSNVLLGRQARVRVREGILLCVVIESRPNRRHHKEEER